SFGASLNNQNRTGLQAVLDRAFPALVAGVLFGFPLVAALPVGLGVSSRMVTVPYRVAVAAASIAWFTGAAASHRKLIDRRFRWCVGILAGMLMLRMFWDRTIVSLPIDLKWDDYFMQVFGLTVFPVLPFLFAVGRLQFVRP